MKAQQQFMRPGAEWQPACSCSDQARPTAAPAGSAGPATSASPLTAAAVSQQWQGGEVGSEIRTWGTGTGLTAPHSRAEPC